MWVLCCVVKVRRCMGLLGSTTLCTGCVVVCFGAMGTGVDCWTFSFLASRFLIILVSLEAGSTPCWLARFGGPVCWGRTGIWVGEAWFRCCLSACCVLGCGDFPTDMMLCWFCVDLLLELLVWVWGLVAVYIALGCWLVVETEPPRGRRGEACKGDNRGGSINLCRRVRVVCDGLWLAMTTGDGQWETLLRRFLQTESRTKTRTKLHTTIKLYKALPLIAHSVNHGSSTSRNGCKMNIPHPKGTGQLLDTD